MKNFIIVQDKAIADKLLLSGFQLVSLNNHTYTFVNAAPQHFNFTDKLIF